MWDTWNSVFRWRSLGIVERSVISELRDSATGGLISHRFRKMTAIVSSTASRLLLACSAAIVAAQVEELKIDLLARNWDGESMRNWLAAGSNRARIVDVALYSVCVRPLLR